MMTQESSQIEKQSFKSGDIIFSQAETGDAAYLLEAGSVTIIQSMFGRRVVLGTIKKGEIFGEMTMIDNGKRMASAVAMTDILVSRIPRPVFERKFASADVFIRGLLNLFIKHIRGSHRSFMRRPRSYRDNIAILEDVADHMSSYAKRLTGEHHAALTARTNALKAAIEDLNELTNTLPDKRHHVILLGEESGAVDMELNKVQWG